MDQLTIRQTSVELRGSAQRTALEPLPRLGAQTRLAASFGPGHYRPLRPSRQRPVGADRRGLKRAIIDRAQTMQLGEALAAELEMTFGDDKAGQP